MIDKVKVKITSDIINKKEKSMKIGKWHVDFKDSQYWVYSKKTLDKKTGKEYPEDTSYFNTLAGALKDVRNSLIGSKIGRDKEDDLSAVMAQILIVDKYFAHCLSELTSEQSNLVNKMPNKKNVGV